MSKRNKLFKRLQQQQQAQSNPPQNRAFAVQVRGEASFSGPLPPPAMLAEYDKVVPGGAGRLVAMAEAQMAHRHQLENRVIGANIVGARVGQVFGFVICMTAILGGVYLIAIGKDATGISSVIGALAAVVGLFIYGRKQQEKERQQKQEALPPQLR